MTAAVLTLFVASAAFAAERCPVCHPTQAAALAQSGMGRSFRAMPVDVPDGEFRHPASGSRVQIRGATHTIRRGDAAIERNALYAVGSGNVGISFLVRSGEWLFQSPASYFSARRAWGPSPGYEKDSTLDFLRPIAEECVFCHAGSAEWVDGSINRFRDPAGSLQGIPCERCHGAGTEHLRQPARGNIVNPARLDGAPRDSVCEQCHLAGVTRVPNPGKRWQDFAPGTRLEDAWSVYVWQRRDDAALHVVSQVEQLAASACARASYGRLWCGSCHSVHGRDRKASSACRSCHSSAHIESRATGRGPCEDCHMPKRPTADGGHTAFTDHRIQRRPELRPASPPRDLPGKLRAWRPGPNEPRNEGLGSIQAGDLLQSAELVQHGFRLLAERQRDFERDPDVLAALGYVLLHKNRPREASRLLDQAVRLSPRNVRLRLNLGLALAASGDTARARATLEEVRRLDPSVEAADVALKQLSKP